MVERLDNEDFSGLVEGAHSLPDQVRCETRTHIRLAWRHGVSDKEMCKVSNGTVIGCQAGFRRSSQAEGRRIEESATWKEGRKRMEGATVAT